MIGKIVAAAQSTYNSPPCAAKRGLIFFYSMVYTAKIL